MIDTLMESPELSTRLREIEQLMTRDMTSKEIGKLDISRKTLEFHRANLRTKA